MCKVSKQKQKKIAQQNIEPQWVDIPLPLQKKKVLQITNGNPREKKNLPLFLINNSHCEVHKLKIRNKSWWDIIGKECWSSLESEQGIFTKKYHHHEIITKLFMIKFLDFRHTLFDLIFLSVAIPSPIPNFLATYKTVYNSRSLYLYNFIYV